MADVVSRLLAAIDEMERPELDARGDHELMWTMGDTADAWHVECRHCGVWTAEGPEGVVNPLADEHARQCVSMPISPVLRLCQAHRDIVARYEHARERSTTAPEAERILWHTRAIALIDVMDALARGYGVEDGETK